MPSEGMVFAKYRGIDRFEYIIGGDVIRRPAHSGASTTEAVKACNVHRWPSTVSGKQTAVVCGVSVCVYMYVCDGDPICLVVSQSLTCFC